MSDSSLERLEKKLTTREEAPEGPERSRLFEKGTGAPEGWDAPAQRVRKRFGLRPLEILFVASVAFFVIAGAIAALLIFSGTNTVSAKNVGIAIDGPTAVRAGDTLPLQIAITNHNSVDMELTDLVVEFPTGSRSETDVSVTLPRTRESLGTIHAGESVNRTARAVVFGKQGQNLEVKVSVEYRVASSNAIFVAPATYTVPVSESPATVTVNSLSEAVSGQAMTITVTVASNVTDILSDMILTADYPPGFTFTSATPAPLTGNTAWRLGDIEALGKRTITIRGTFTAEDGEERVIRFSAGTKGANEGEIAAPLAAGDATVTVKKPFVGIALALDGGQGAEHTVVRGAPIRGDVTWTNNLPDAVEDVTIEVALKGAILDRTSVFTTQGFYRSQDNTIVFSRQNDPRLATVGPGASAVSTFSFATLPLSAGTFRNPQLDVVVTVHARRVGDSNVPEEITSSATSKILVATDLALSAALSRTGIFTNTGPIPPKADVESTYTVIWTVTNTANSVANASVSATLPSYVRYTGMASPGEDVSFNAVGGVVTWKIGDLSEGASRTVSFQIGFTPSVSQVNQTPVLVSNQRAYGFDRFTKTQIEKTAQPLSSQSGLSPQQGSVVP